MLSRVYTKLGGKKSDMGTAIGSDRAFFPRQCPSVHLSFCFEHCRRSCESFFGSGKKLTCENACSLGLVGGVSRLCRPPRASSPPAGCCENGMQVHCGVLLTHRASRRQRWSPADRQTQAAGAWHRMCGRSGGEMR